MKTVLLFKPKLLAEVKRKSPALFEYYSNSPIANIEYADYGILSMHYYIQKEILDKLEPFKKDKDMNVGGVIGALQIGYIFGMIDFMERFPKDNASPMQGTHLIRTVLKLVYEYHFYTIESLLDVNNFGYREGLSYNKSTYKDAQYFIAWNTVFHSEEGFNEFFELLNAKIKRGDRDIKEMLESTYNYN